MSCRLVVSEGEGVGGFVLVYSPRLRLTRAVVVVDGGGLLAFVSAGEVAGVSCRLVVSEGEGVGGLVLVYPPRLRLTRAVIVVDGGVRWRSSAPVTWQSRPARLVLSEGRGEGARAYSPDAGACLRRRQWWWGFDGGWCWAAGCRRGRSGAIGGDGCNSRGGVDGVGVGCCRQRWWMGWSSLSLSSAAVNGWW
jgi:hypothetical protein